MVVERLPRGRIPNVDGQRVRGLARLTNAGQDELQKVLDLRRRWTTLVVDGMRDQVKYGLLQRLVERRDRGRLFSL